MNLSRLAFAALLSVSTLTSPLARAEDGHELSSIKGDMNIDLKTYDHAMAGSVKGFVMWGGVNEAEGKSELIMRRDGQDVKAVFAQVDKTFGGTVVHTTDYLTSP